MMNRTNNAIIKIIIVLCINSLIITYGIYRIIETQTKQTIQNPLRQTNSNVIGPTLIPQRRLSSSSQHKYGGLTADIGWILMVARYALTPDAWDGRTPIYSDKSTQHRTIQLPDHWGHGPGNWSSLIRPLPNTNTHTLELVQENAHDRKLVKMKRLYKKGVPRNRLIHQIINSNNYNDDITAMRYIFQWIFQLQPRARKHVNAIKRQIHQHIDISVHIRRGDKVGEKEGPKEGRFIPILKYANKIRKYTTQNKTNVFAASDDYNTIIQLQQELGNNYNVLTLTHPQKDGFSIVEYRQLDENTKYNATIQLWADLELMAKSRIFIGSFESNIARIVHIMRFNKNPNTSIPMTGELCPKDLEKRFNTNNFWNCQE